VWQEQCCIHQLEFVFNQVESAQPKSSKRFTRIWAIVLDTLAHSDEYGIACANSHETGELTELFALFRLVATNTCRHRTPTTVPRRYLYLLSSIFLLCSFMRQVAIFLYRAVIELNRCQCPTTLSIQASTAPLGDSCRKNNVTPYEFTIYIALTG
jgi:hypothetical protein